MNPIDGKEKKMNRILLRPVKNNDFDFMMKLVNDKQVKKYLPGLILDEKMLARWFRSLDDSSNEYIILLAESDLKIGECSLSAVGNAVEAGLMILPEYWNKGLGTETVEMLLEMAKNSGQSKVTATSDKSNTAMIKILEKTGFALQKEGFMWQISEDGIDLINSGQSILTYEKRFA